MKITFLGHASLFVEINDIKIIVDPFISGNPEAKDIKVQDIKVDFILITHAHQDHILDVETIAQNNPEALIISNYEITMYYLNKGFKGHPLNHGGGKIFNFGHLKYVDAIHTSSFPDGTYGGEPGGFVITANNKRVYIAGDTALTYDMKLIPLSGAIDLAILPIGDNFTMGYEDASIAAQFLETRNVLGYHYDTFPPIEIDKVAAMESFSKIGVTLNLLKVNESMEV